MSTDWKQIIRTVAPALATALGGPLAGMATTAISEATLGNTDGSVEEISAAVLRGGPEMLARIKEAEYGFRAKMKELEIDLEKIDAGDRASARDREKALKDKTPPVLAGIIFTGFFLIIAGFMFVKIEAGAMQGLLILVGALAAGIGQILNYYFGSSSGSSRKNDILEGIIKK